MKCPECGGPTTVKETRQPDRIGHKAVMAFAVDWPALLIRRRHCPKHGTFLTAELPFLDLTTIQKGAEWQPTSPS